MDASNKVPGAALEEVKPVSGRTFIFSCGNGYHWTLHHNTFVKEEQKGLECCCSRDELQKLKLMIIDTLGVPPEFLGGYPSQERTDRISHEILEPIAKVFGDEFLNQAAMFFCTGDTP